MNQTGRRQLKFIAARLTVINYDVADITEQLEQICENEQEKISNLSDYPQFETKVEETEEVVTILEELKTDLDSISELLENCVAELTQI